MKKNKAISFEAARDILIASTSVMDVEQIPLPLCAGRVLAQEVIAMDNVPPFDRSPYDGYAFSAADTLQADHDHPVTLQILEEIPAGGISHMPVVSGTAVKILTGAPIPDGADAVCMFEKTEFTDNTVTLFDAFKPGQNVIYAGEDIKQGTVLAQHGMVIDAGLLGTMASQNISKPFVYRKPRIGIISTGSELVEVGTTLQEGQIYNTNRYTLTAAISRLGCEPVYIGCGKDNEERIAELFFEAINTCDAVVSTGGVSVGDYDLTPAAMERCDVQILFRGVDLKPGMACAYGAIDGKPIIGLSGNPASSLTNFYVIAVPAIRKLCGYHDIIPEYFEIILKDGFKKPSRSTRILRGTLDLSSGTVAMLLPKDQGNVVLSSTIGCNVLAMIPAGSGPIAPGTKLKGMLI